MSLHKEISFETEICDHLAAHGWLYAEGELVRKDGESAAHEPYRLSGVLEHNHGRWRWRMFHGSRPAAG